MRQRDDHLSIRTSQPRRAKRAVATARAAPSRGRASYRTQQSRGVAGLAREDLPTPETHEREKENEVHTNPRRITFSVTAFD